MSDQSIKRKRYIVKRTFQLKYTLTILFFILATLLLAVTTTYYTIFPYLSAKLANVYPQSRLVGILSNVNLRLLYASVVLAPIAIWIGIVLSHKIAGPWYRLEGILLRMANGKTVEEIKLRKGYELISLADAVNAVTARLRVDKNRTKENLDQLQNNLDKLHKELNSSKPDFNKAKQEISRLSDSTKALKSIIA